MSTAMPDADDRTLAAWLSEGPERGPESVLERAFASTRTIRQRPGWTIPGWWVPETVAHSRTTRLAMLVVVALLMIGILVLAVSGSIPETRRQDTTPFVDRILMRGPLDQELTLYSVDVPGAAPRRLESAQGFPDVSPDGSNVLFDSSAPGPMIGIARTDGSGHRMFSDPGAVALAEQWSPDSAAVVWDSVTGDGSPYLAIAAPNSDIARRINLPRVRPFGEPIGDVGYAWSPDNRQVVLYEMVDWCAEGVGESLYVVDIDTDAVQRIDIPGHLLDLPSWSADGRRFAAVFADVTSSPPDCQPASWSLSVVDVAAVATTRTVVHRSTAELGGSAPQVHWASDDRALVIPVRAGDGGLTIRSMPVDGGQPNELATVDADGVIWSPDRRSFAWLGSSTGGASGSESDLNLWIMDVDHPVPRQIASSVTYEAGAWPSWSPDGTWIAFTRGPIDARKGTGSLWLVRPDGTGETLVSKDDGLDYRDIFW